ncbi:CerR family C-terminal domain-containing protein [Pokkaliibacter sp. MBI-7]|uniref:CerR family C-terminal domain-containing protein n=1 Tax=Pokkaliibacter sp. MBI-7 TaxID=3040600 RepID=UPI0024481444|nr:CerR family C-terminal domain-containing protein [Pokkaliibacter sp. MBI-7]MDH2435532.1 CerR family C-terminal domain-containing protein [Pokkaliibacter sp. MBI-7]
MLTALELFVTRGFAGTSVRMICEQADVNVSMVKYYFGSKEKLYLAAIDYARNNENQPLAEQRIVNQHLSAEQRLYQFILSFLQNLLQPTPNTYLTRLIAGELTSPTSALSNIIEQDIKPQHRYLAELVTTLAGRSLSDEEVQKINFSLIGQCLFYLSNRPLNDVIAPGLSYDEQGIEQLATHIYTFTLNAIQHH